MTLLFLARFQGLHVNSEHIFGFLAEKTSLMRLISLTCEMLLFLAVRHAIAGSSLIAVPFIFRLSYFLGVRLLFLAWLYLALLFLAGMGSRLMVPVSSHELVLEQVEVFQCDMW
jgi:hypothetical protein